MLPAPASPRAGTKRIALRRPMPSSIAMLWIETMPNAVCTPHPCRNSATRSATVYVSAILVRSLDSPAVGRIGIRGIIDRTTAAAQRPGERQAGRPLSDGQHARPRRLAAFQVAVRLGGILQRVAVVDLDLHDPLPHRADDVTGDLLQFRPVERDRKRVG